jgi:hypothetical protein
MITTDSRIRNLNLRGPVRSDVDPVTSFGALDVAVDAIGNLGFAKIIEYELKQDVASYFFFFDLAGKNMLNEGLIVWLQKTSTTMTINIKMIMIMIMIKKIKSVILI